MSTAVTTLAASLLACAFGWAGVAKLAQLGDWREALEGYEIPRGLTPVALLGVPLTEMVVVALLLAGPVKAGAALAVALVALFSMAIVRARARRGDRLPCGCFGRTQARDYRLMLIRNALLAALAAVVLVSRAATGVVQELGDLSITDIVPVTLVGLGFITTLWTARQVTNALRGRQS